MAHYAKIENNIVTQVIVAEPEFFDTFVDNSPGEWLQTSYNTFGGVHRDGGVPFRKNYAGEGGTYDATRDAFYPASPFASWVLNDTTCKWECPIDLPADTSKAWHWDEAAYQADNSTGWVETEGT